MAVYIYDLDEIFIRVVTPIATHDVPKFRITMEVDEPYLYLYWTDTEKGDAGERRLVKINYTDVEPDYSGAIPTPTSAEVLYDTINEMIRSAFGGGDGVQYPIPVDGVTITGGTSEFDPLVAVGSSSASTSELTPELFADGNVTGIGADQWLDDLGYTDGTAATTWPLTAANYPGGLTAAGFTLDTVVWQELFYFVESTGAAAMTTSVTYPTAVNKSYYVNKTLYLPRHQLAVASSKRSLSFQIDFKGANVRNSSGGDMILFDRYPVDQDDADAILGYQYTFWNSGQIRGNGGNDEADTLFRLGATIRSEFKNINMTTCGVGADLQFCLEPVLENINVSDYGLYGVAIRNGEWTDAGFFNAQSNIAMVSQFRSYNASGRTPVAALYTGGNHTLNFRSLTFEGFNGSEHHFFYDNQGTAGTNPCTLTDVYMEGAGCSRAGIRFRGKKGQFVLTNFRSAVPDSDMPVLIEGDNDFSPTSVLQLIIKNSAFEQIDSKFRAVGDPNYPVLWDVENVNMNDNIQLNRAANFETGVITNSYIPEDSHVRFTPPVNANIYDADAQDLIDAIDTLQPWVAKAWSNFVEGAKDAGLWSTKLVAVYPMIGGSLDTCKWNGKNVSNTDAAFRITYTGTVSANSNGLQFPGITGNWANTHLNPTIDLTQNDTHIFISRRNNANSTTGGVDIGIEGSASARFLLTTRNANDFYNIQYIFPTNNIQVASLNSIGRFCGTRTSSTVLKSFKNGVQVGATDVDASAGWANINYKVYLGASNNVGTASAFSLLDTDFVTMGLGLTDADVLALDGLVATFNAEIGR